MAKKVTVTEEKEPWYKSRRIWGALFAAASAALIQLGYVDFASALAAVAGAFGIRSFTKQK